MRCVVCLSFAALTLSAAALAEELSIDTVAGTGAAQNNCDAGPALVVNISDPFGVEIGPDGALYVTEVGHHRIRRVDLATGELTTVAGCGRRGYSGDGGIATNAELNEPYEVRFDRDGHMVFVEMQNHVIRRVNAKTKIITTLAGTGRAGFGGDGGPAAGAEFRQPHSIAFDSRGALYVADIGNHRVRRIDRKTGVIESIAGNSQRRLPQDGQPARGNPILGPRALVIDGETLWIALREGHSVWRMDLAEGVLHHVAGLGEAGYAGDGGPPRDAKFNGPKGIAIDAGGAVYVVDTENHAIRKIELATNRITTVAGGGPNEQGGLGDGGPAAAAQLNRPHGICVNAGGEVFIGDTLNRGVRRVK